MKRLVFIIFSPLPSNLLYPLHGVLEKYWKSRKVCRKNKTKPKPNTKGSEGYLYVLLIQKYIHRCQENICKLLTGNLVHLISIYYCLATNPKVLVLSCRSRRAEEQSCLPNQNNRTTKPLPLLQEAKQHSCRALLPSQVTYTEIYSGGQAMEEWPGGIKDICSSYKLVLVLLVCS